MSHSRAFTSSQRPRRVGEIGQRVLNERPGMTDSVCSHPRCHQNPQERYDFPLPLCSEHLVKTLTAAVQVIRAAKLDPSKATPPPERVRNEIIYYIKFGSRIKIGTTTNLVGRLKTIPHDTVLAVEPGGRTLEHQRHREFAAHRITGEWFAPAPELMSHIATLRRW